MKQIIENFNRQFEYQPVIENAANLKPADKFVICGMGGSHLAADLLKLFTPKIDLIIHKDYGLPALTASDLSSRLFILSSYSGNTEEVLDSLNQAMAQNLNILTISIGGKLLEIAKQHSLPYIQMPDTKINPRNALGFSFMAMLKATDNQAGLEDASKLAESLDPAKLELQGKAIADITYNSIPVVYSSRANEAIAYNWKIKLNETGKIPAFYNVLPEMNHNEINSFDVREATKKLSANLHFITLTDPTDHPQIQKRMRILKDLYAARGLNTETIEMNETDPYLRAFSAIVLGDWVSYYTALNYNLDPEKVPMIEELKKLIV